MRLTIAAIGRLKDGPERVLFDRYWDRLGALGPKLAMAPIKLVEFPESRAGFPDTRKSEEARRLLAAATTDRRIVLDERGMALNSEAFAAFIRRERDHGAAGLAFLIGGPDGHDETARHGAALVLALGAMTVPHGLARVILAEQLYRTATILAGHPYHRA